MERTLQEFRFDCVADVAMWSCKGTWKPSSQYKPKRQNVLSRIEDPVGDLFLVPQYDYVIDVVFVRTITRLSYAKVNVSTSFQRDGDSIVKFGFVRHDHDISRHFSRG